MRQRLPFREAEYRKHVSFALFVISRDANSRSHAALAILRRGGALRASGEIASVNTLFLTNRECPWHCVMCDLWKNTLTETVPVGAIPAQIEYALARLPTARVIKLYNSGSFFDPRAVPVADYPAIAKSVDAL